MRHKWKRRRGFLKLHIIVDVETRKILGFKATSEEVPDTRMLPELLNQAQSKAEVEAALGDGGQRHPGLLQPVQRTGRKTPLPSKEERLHKVPRLPLEGQCH